MLHAQQTPAIFRAVLCVPAFEFCCVHCACIASDRISLLQVLSFILSHTTDGAGAAVLDAALSTELSPLKAKVSRPLLLAPIVGASNNNFQ